MRSPFLRIEKKKSKNMVSKKITTTTAIRLFNVNYIQKQVNKNMEMGKNL